MFVWDFASCHVGDKTLLALSRLQPETTLRWQEPRPLYVVEKRIKADKGNKKAQKHSTVQRRSWCSKVTSMSRNSKHVFYPVFGFLFLGMTFWVNRALNSLFCEVCWQGLCSNFEFCFWAASCPKVRIWASVLENKQFAVFVGSCDQFCFWKTMICSCCYALQAEQELLNYCSQFL